MSEPSPIDALRQFRQRQASRYAEGQSDALVGVSPAMVRARAQVEAAVASNASVLVTGRDALQLVEIAEGIHYRRYPLGEAPLWRIEAEVALPSEYPRAINQLMRDEVEGTLLIEQIDLVPAEQQVELLTAMAAASWHAQLIATRPLRDGPAEPGMSDELTALVSTIPLQVPPLAERPEDIPPLVAWHLERLNRESPDTKVEIGDDALDLLMIYGWPGEMSELRSVLAAAYRRAKGPLVAARDLPRTLHHAVEHAALAPNKPSPIDLDDYLSRVEAALVQRALELAGGNKAEAARLLGVSRPRLYRKLVQMGLAEPPPSELKPRPKPAPSPASEATPPPADDDDIEFLPVDGE